MTIVDPKNLTQVIEDAVDNVQITDVHTHIYAKDFKDLLLYGIDELLTYHYILAEYFRYSKVSYSEFFALDKNKQADLIWQALFVGKSPISEALRGVLTVLKKLGLDPHEKDLRSYRNYFSNVDIDEYLNRVFQLAGIKDVVMTNDPFDDLERPVWEKRRDDDPRFKSALRIDYLLNHYDQACGRLCEMGYTVDPHLKEPNSIKEIRRFLDDWANKMNPLYLAASMPPDFEFPEDTARGKIIREAIIPLCEERNLPFGMMIGVKRAVNPQMGLAGDALGVCSLSSVENLCREYPSVNFLVTVLSRENQHELIVLARKFRNLKIFGCWWYVIVPSLMEEITRMRMELLGFSFIPQHSDARVLEQLIYKWDHSKQVIVKVVRDKYLDLINTGWTLKKEDVQKDIKYWLHDQFWEFLDK